MLKIIFLILMKMLLNAEKNHFKVAAGEDGVNYNNFM